MDIVDRLSKNNNECINDINECINDIDDKFNSNNKKNIEGFETIHNTDSLLIIKHDKTGTLYKLAFVTTQQLTINSQQKLYFN